jgi:hypothetical protein
LDKPWFEKCGNIWQTKEKEEVTKFYFLSHISISINIICIQTSKYEELLAKEFYKKFAESQLIAVFHENSSKAYELLKVRLFIYLFCAFC